MTEESRTATARAGHHPVLAAWRFVRMIVSSLVLLFLYKCILLIRRPRDPYALALVWQQRWSRSMLHAAGLDVRYSGPLPPSNAFIVGNHQTYADVWALNSIIKTFFVVKLDIEEGWFAKSLIQSSLQITVSRADRHALSNTIDEVAERLRQGYPVCAFLEGTTSYTYKLLPFRPGLMQAPITVDAPVVPIAIRWWADDPNVDIADDVAYWRDHDFGKHLWRLLGLRGIHAEIIFLPPLEDVQRDRKVLSNASRSVISNVLGYDE